MGTSLYSLLEIGQDASPQEIRRAYYRLAKLWHPDVNRSREAHVRFIQISRAYRILSDPAARSRYDQKLADPWKARQRRDYYRYGTSSRPPGGMPGQASDDPGPLSTSPALDRFLFIVLLIFGLGAIALGILDLFIERERKLVKYSGLIFGLVFTVLLVYGWRLLKKESSSGQKPRQGQ